MQCNGLGVSSFTWNGKRHMTPGGTIEYCSSFDSVEVQIESRKRINVSDFLTTGTLQLILWYNGKKERVTIEEAFMREYVRCPLDLAGTEVTRIIFTAPPFMEAPVAIRTGAGYVTWQFPSEAAEAYVEPTDGDDGDDDDEQEYEDYDYCVW